MNTDTLSRPWQVAAALDSFRFNLNSERECQDGITKVLIDVYGADRVQREHILGPKDRVDWLLDGAIAIECKVKGANKMACYKQLQRYANHDCVKGIVLVTSLAMGLPEAIDGVPTAMVRLGRAYL